MGEPGTQLGYLSVSDSPSLDPALFIPGLSLNEGDRLRHFNDPYLGSHTNSGLCPLTVDSEPGDTTMDLCHERLSCCL